MGPRVDVPIEGVEAFAYRIPTEEPESDGTLAWDATVLVVAEVRAGGMAGWGYTYADAAVASLIRSKLADVLRGKDAFATEAAWQAMGGFLRNLGGPGLSAMAVSALDVGLWDLKAKLLGLPLARLLGQVRDAVEVYGSGGFTSYTPARLQSQLAAWASEGMARVKMKVGRDPDADPWRVEAAREAIGETALFVDANGAYAAEQAIGLAHRFAEAGVVWFEEPVPHWDRAGTRTVRERIPAGMDVAGGEYGYRPEDFHLLIHQETLSFLQADATRCGGITGFLKAAALCEAADMPLSSHCAPSLHVALGCAAQPMRHLEWFHDHVLIEEKLFEGFARPRAGRLAPDLSRPGLGFEFKREDARALAV
ncbi:MAG: mandelate racemase [Fibrobacteres bacterium]|nr:mandelate racemase [Fibrobacterota bacterium]